MPLKNPNPQETVHTSKTIEDGLLASGLITAPAWGAWLSQLNHILTTLSLMIGVTLGLYRLWRAYQNIYRPTVENENQDRSEKNK